MYSHLMGQLPLMLCNLRQWTVCLCLLQFMQQQAELARQDRMAAAEAQKQSRLAAAELYKQDKLVADQRSADIIKASELRANEQLDAQKLDRHAAEQRAKRTGKLLNSALSQKN